MLTDFRKTLNARKLKQNNAMKEIAPLASTWHRVALKDLTLRNLKFFIFC
jgi:hypothetical protein